MFAQVRYRLQQTILRSRIVENPTTPISSKGSCVSLYSTSTRIYRGPISRSLRKRINRRARLAAKPVLDKTVFQKCVSQLLPRFTPEDLHNVIIEQDDPLVCLELFNWASQQHRFRHTVFTYHVTIRKLGAAKMYKEMDDIVNQCFPWEIKRMSPCLAHCLRLKPRVMRSHMLRCCSGCALLMWQYDGDKNLWGWNEEDRKHIGHCFHF
ncbi:pentatricopeptide repeat-containing protein At2g27800, mitochondrial-like [Andrographis paniculata]|uniref:pentatricopeptide repeat-containing protein At2g27800, mitochondrial-like n=1 Tax=Andrographis paniculata TaxID=175694 RepID=UPI0021E8865A|nr:pentatricopeptide repeat-containing protein At2g27800, mitochondrial-like [Andrographis paniculata]XP_051113963.1 pentatricopeptide repeat-containing protein At2g27800, mitochondrial-like [Andrographis paniculata]XP_051113964.1 pentatricopeptide repeat-containing protein At2g27800, mitochondrial-like [Andrographis paniculata]